MQPLEVAQRESVIALEIIIISAVEICIREIKKVFCQTKHKNELV